MVLPGHANNPFVANNNLDDSVSVENINLGKIILDSNPAYYDLLVPGTKVVVAYKDALNSAFTDNQNGRYTNNSHPNTGVIVNSQIDGATPVLIHYVDSNGNQIANPQYITGNNINGGSTWDNNQANGDSFNVDVPSPSGYTYNSIYKHNANVNATKGINGDAIVNGAFSRDTDIGDNSNDSDEIFLQYNAISKVVPVEKNNNMTIQNRTMYGYTNVNSLTSSNTNSNVQINSNNSTILSNRGQKQSNHATAATDSGDPTTSSEAKKPNESNHPNAATNPGRSSAAVVIPPQPKPSSSIANKQPHQGNHGNAAVNSGSSSQPKPSSEASHKPRESNHPNAAVDGGSPTPEHKPNNPPTTPNKPNNPPTKKPHVSDTNISTVTYGGNKPNDPQTPNNLSTRGGDRQFEKRKAIYNQKTIFGKNGSISLQLGYAKKNNKGNYVADGRRKTQVVHLTPKQYLGYMRVAKSMPKQEYNHLMKNSSARNKYFKEVAKERAKANGVNNNHYKELKNGKLLAHKGSTTVPAGTKLKDVPKLFDKSNIEKRKVRHIKSAHQVVQNSANQAVAIRKKDNVKGRHNSVVNGRKNDLKNKYNKQDAYDARHGRGNYGAKYNSWKRDRQAAAHDTLQKKQYKAYKKAGGKGTLGDFNSQDATYKTSLKKNPKLQAKINSVTLTGTKKTGKTKLTTSQRIAAAKKDMRNAAKASKDVRDLEGHTGNAKGKYNSKVAQKALKNYNHTVNQARRDGVTNQKITNTVTKAGLNKKGLNKQDRYNWTKESAAALKNHTTASKKAASAAKRDVEGGAKTTTKQTANGKTRTVSSKKMVAHNDSAKKPNKSTQGPLYNNKMLKDGGATGNSLSPRMGGANAAVAASTAADTPRVRTVSGKNQVLGHNKKHATKSTNVNRANRATGASAKHATQKHVQTKQNTAKKATKRPAQNNRGAQQRQQRAKQQRSVATQRASAAAKVRQSIARSTQASIARSTQASIARSVRASIQRSIAERRAEERQAEERAEHRARAASGPVR